ncbi:MAG TPA: hypothetical protein VFO59_05350 [Dehalococcoidia bacterium]|nr:hypothetical protein [Dehalococcoidia bacterium]
MTTAHTSAEIVERDGVLVGPLREPRNLAANIAGSIHDDSQAQRLGFRGGTVAGSIHMEQFPPVLLRAFGERWFETGSLSCYFRNATMDRERVRAFADLPPSGAADAQVNVWMDREDGMRVLDGTASVGSPAEPSMLRRKVAEPREAGELRILGHLPLGDAGPAVTVNLAREREAKSRLEAITEALDWYTGASPWGGPVVNPGLLVHMMVQVQRRMALPADAVGLYGAIEVRHLAGPVFSDREYEVSGRIVATGQTPKTEYLWYETTLREGAKDVASMLMMLRFMKASSPLWAEG